MLQKSFLGIKKGGIITSLFFPEDTNDMYDYFPSDFVLGDDCYIPEEYMGEKWFYADNHPEYMVSDKGRIYSSKKGIILTPKKGDKHGHKSYCLNSNGHKKYEYVHRLVAKAFIPNDNNYPNVLHKDDDPDNNWASNLKWGNQKQNHEDCVANGHFKPFTDEDREKSYQKTRKPIIATKLDTGEETYFRGQCEAARILGLQQANIGKVLLGQREKTCGYSFRFVEKDKQKEITMNVVGIIKFDNRNVCVFKDIDDPLFKLRDVISMLKYAGDMNELVALCEVDEYVTEQVDGEEVYFINERGLYNVLSQLRDSTSRKWRRVIFNQLIELRKSRNMNIVEQFDEWDHALDDIYYDEETGMLMQSVTVAGGDVIQVPYEG